jgi:hypothetical protein
MGEHLEEEEDIVLFRVETQEMGRILNKHQELLTPAGDRKQISFKFLEAIS